MSNQIKAKNHELLTDLSLSEQEAVTGGFGMENLFSSFFFQKTNINTFAEADTNISSAGISSSRRTGYNFSQITLAFTSPWSSRRRSRPSRYQMRSIFNLFRSLFDD